MSHPEHAVDSQDRLRAAFERHYESLFRAALLVTGSVEEAEDIVQESFLKAEPKLRALADDEVRPYLRAVVINGWRDRLRKQRRFTTKGFMVPQESHTLDPEGHDVMWHLVLGLPPRQRACVVLRFYEDLSLNEIAGVLGCSVGTVKSQLHRGIERIREGYADADRG